MKVNRFPLVFVILAMFLYSCEVTISTGDGGGGNHSERQTRTFWAQNTTTGAFYTVNAELLYQGEKCYVWGEISARVSEETAQSIANTYDKTIFPKMVDAFSNGTEFRDEDGVIVARNPMELADYYGDGNGKLIILLLNIRDSYGVGGNRAFVQGYFWSGDMFSRSVVPNSNEADMIYIDTNPGRPGTKDSNSTLAHEMQHLMNFALSVAKRGRPMDLWIDEGLATSSAWIWSGEHDRDQVSWYNEDPFGTIRGGNNFFVWGNKTETNQGVVLDDYSTVYLFFQWLRLQAGSANIYRNIINSEYYDVRAVTSAANAAIPGMGYNEWGTLLRNWFAANYVNASSGPYGYRNDSLLRTIQPKYLTGNPGSFPLAPGEGVYTQKTSMPSATNYVKYAGLPERGSQTAPNSNATATGFSALLSYNIDTNTEGTASPSNPFSLETIPPPTDTDLQPNRSMGQSHLLTRPFPVSARDMLARNGHREHNIDFQQLRQGIKISE